ncbi:hypothetical protein [Streptomyces sp. NPDC002133]|uniref:hypothetical protein n=1 Tax=Streptomyces sp. NPDC002133 TaxID=3154409 RepID=UPI00332FC4E2
MTGRLRGCLIRVRGGAGIRDARLQGVEPCAPHGSGARFGTRCAELLEEIFKAHDSAWYATNPVLLSVFEDPDGERERAGFRAECPHLADEYGDYRERLRAALAPTFAGR